MEPTFKWMAASAKFKEAGLKYIIGEKSLVVIFTAILLDAVGFGLIFPILPSLLREVTHADSVAPYIGIMTAIYAVVQFVFAPVLGAFSDRMGRRPVLLISLSGAAVSYIFMAFGTRLWMVLVGRAIAGLTSANIAVATAYITDISPVDKRAARFGVFNAMFGIGFIIGPVLGGLLGDYWLRLPFFTAAVLNLLNLALALFILPESHKPGHVKIEVGTLNPLRPIGWAFKVKGILPLITVYFMFMGASEAYGTCWALWSYDVFRWNAFWVGLSLGAYGICQALAQALVSGKAVKLLGERATIVFGIACAFLALIVMAFTQKGWIIFAILPVLGLSSVGTPALQSLATRQVDEAQQGQFQGVLASVVGLATIVGPLTFSTIYFSIQRQWPGAIWLSVVVVYAIVVPLVRGLQLKKAEPAAT